MSVKRRLFWLLVAIATIFALVLSGLVLWERKQIADLEQARLQGRKDSLQRFLTHWGAGLENFVKTYSTSKSVAAAVASGQRAELETELSEDAMASYRIQAFWVYRPDKTLLATTNRLYTDALPDVLLPRSSFEEAFSGSVSPSFFAKVPLGVVEIRGARIGAQGDAAQGGYIFAGRVWSDEELKEMSTFTGDEMRLVDAKYSTTGLTLPTGEFAFTHALNGWGGKPVSQLLVRSESPILRHASEMRWRASLWILGLLIVLTVATVFALERWVWRPLSTVLRGLRTEQPNTVLPYENDRTEIGEIARLIRGFFEQRDGLIKEMRDKRQLEKAIREDEDQSHKMDAIARLAGGVAHDFNNLLTAIVGYAGLLFERVKGEPEARHDCEQIIQAADHAAAVSRQLLAFSRKQVLQPKVLDLNEVLTEVEPELKATLGEGIEMKLTADAPQSLVKVDPDQVKQIITNLVSNAKDAMPNGGTLTIGTATTFIPEPTQQGGLRMPAGSYVTLEVTDTGSGMDEQTKERMFEPFFTTKARDKRTGLGLSMIYGILQQSGGAIAVVSSPGQGSTFLVHFPMSAATPRVESGRGQSVRNVRTNASPTILLVEDDADIRAMVSEAFREQQIAILTAYDADSALLAARKHGEPISLLITEAMLPGRSGLEVATDLSRTQPGLRVLYISGYGDGTGEKLQLPVESEVIEKPFTPAVLTERARQMISGEISQPV